LTTVPIGHQQELKGKHVSVMLSSKTLLHLSLVKQRVMQEATAVLIDSWLEGREGLIDTADKIFLVLVMSCQTSCTLEARSSPVFPG